jgi:hypothetical protein
MNDKQTDHIPQQEDQITEWLTARREQTQPYYGEAWMALDNLLTEYREAAEQKKSLRDVIDAEPEHLTPAQRRARRELRRQRDAERTLGIPEDWKMAPPKLEGDND